MTRIAVGAIQHESHGFSPIATDLSAFRNVELLLGEDVIRRHAGRKSEIGGILDVASSRKWEIVPTVSATAIPLGA